MKTSTENKYKELFNYDNVKKEFDVFMEDKYYGKKILKDLMYTRKFGNEKDMEEVYARIQSHHKLHYFIAEKLNNPLYLEQCLFKDEDKDFSIFTQEVYSSPTVSKIVKYLTFTSVGGNKIKPKGLKSVNYIYAIHVVDSNHFIDFEKGFLKIQDVLNKESLRLIGDTIKPEKINKEIIESLYNPLNKIADTEQHLYKEIHEEINENEKVVVIDFIGVFNAIDLSFEYLTEKYKDNLDVEIKKEEIYKKYSLARLGVLVEHLDIITAIVLANAKKDSDISSIF